MVLRRRIPVLLSLAAYLLAGALGGWHLAGHSHHHVVVLRDAGDQTAARGCCGQHEHGKRPATQPQRHVPHRDRHDDCRICEVLAQKPMPVAVVAVVSASEPVHERAVDPIVHPELTPPALPLSRAPPCEF